jgi:protein phosphatase 1 regulatory subunit 7
MSELSNKNENDHPSLSSGDGGGKKKATVDRSSIPLDWTKFGNMEEDDWTIRYPRDVVEWTPQDLEVYSVGTAGQKITLLGNDLLDSTQTNPDLETLVLRSHLIKSMAGLGSLSKLQLLELYDNIVQGLDEESLMGCGPSLKTLDMSYNAIRDMSPVRLCCTRTGSNLTELYLANNKLKEIAGLSGLVNLKKLDLGANRIRVMNPNELSGLINLEELWIGKNKIEEVDGLTKVGVLESLKSIASIFTIVSTNTSNDIL